MKNVHLLVIDPQIDFCDPNGSLFVPGADEDINRLSKWVNQQKDKISAIHVTLDNHHVVDIAHPIFWVSSNGDHPDPFTIISTSDVKNEIWRTRNPSFQKRATEYVNALEINNRYPLCIWPPHCLIGSNGASVSPELFDSLIEWEIEKFNIVNYVTKGSNCWTEHYSAIQADVPDHEDETTQLNIDLMEYLENADMVIVSGEALSNCLKFTVEDIANNFKDPSYIKKMVLLEDTSSSVPTLEQQGQDFITEMAKRGMQISNTKDFLI